MGGSVLGMCRRKGGSYDKFLFAERFWFKARFGAAGILCVFQGSEPPYWSKRSGEVRGFWQRSRCGGRHRAYRDRIRRTCSAGSVPDGLPRPSGRSPDRPAADGRGRSYLRSVFQNVLDLFRIADADGREDRNLDGLADRRRIRHQQAAALRQTVRRRGHQVGRGQSSR